MVSVKVREICLFEINKAFWMKKGSRFISEMADLAPSEAGTPHREPKAQIPPLSTVLYAFFLIHQRTANAATNKGFQCLLT